MQQYPVQESEASVPRNTHAEMTILGALLVEPLAIMEATLSLQEDDFFLDSNRRIFRAVVRMSIDNRPVDIVTVADELKKRRELDLVGGVPYLASLSEGLPRRLNIGSYIRIVKEKSRLRNLIQRGEELLNSAMEEGTESSIIATRMASMMQDIANSSDDNDIPHVRDFLDSQGSPEQMFEQMASTDGIPFGFKDVDRILGGAQRGDLIIVAARPSMGKTAWLANVAYHCGVRQGLTVAAFTLEQKKKFIVRRMLASSARIDYNDIKKNNLTAAEKADLLERRKRIHDSNLFIEDASGLTATKIKAKCTRLKHKEEKLDLVLIDQLSHVSNADVFRPGIQFPQLVGLQTKMFKRMAKELDVPVVVFNQLSRETGKRKDFIPVLADLKESGNIEEDADVVLFLHRPAYYDKENDDLKGIGQQIIAKQREGATGTVNCIYQGELMLWADEAPKMQDNDYYQRSFTAADYMLPDYPDDRDHPHFR